MHMSHMQRKRAALQLKSSSKVSFKSRRPTIQNNVMGLPKWQLHTCTWLYWQNWVYSLHLLVFLFHLLLLCKTSSFCWFSRWKPETTASSPLITHFQHSYLSPSKSHAQAKHLISDLLFFFRRLAVLSSNVFSACSSRCSMDMWHVILYSLCFSSFSIIESAVLKMIFFYFFLQLHWAFGMDIMEITVWFLDPIPPG